MRTKYTNCYILTMLDDKINKCDLAVDGEKIIDISSNIEGEFDTIVDCHGGLLIPGLIDAFSSVFTRCFMQEFDHICDEDCERKISEILAPTEEISSVTVTKILDEYTRCGVTTLVDDGNIDRLGVAPVSGKISIIELLGSTPSHILTDEEIEIKIRELSHEGTLAMYGADSAIFDEGEYMRLMKNARESDLSLFMRISTNLSSVGQCDARFNTTPIGLAEEYGALSDRAVLVGCTHADRQDLERIAESGASIVVTPSDELHLAGGMCPLYAMKNKDISIALGTGYTGTNLFCEMARACDNQRAMLAMTDPFDSYELLSMATSRAAEVLHLSDRGVLQKGKFADIILLDNIVDTLDARCVLDDVIYHRGVSAISTVIHHGQVVYRS